MIGLGLGTGHRHLGAVGLVAPAFSGTMLRGYQVSATGLGGIAPQWQARTSAAGPWTDVSLGNPFTLGSGNVGRAYRVQVTHGGTTYSSDPLGPVGITDSILPTSSAYRSVGQDVAALNTDGAGKNAGYARGTDYYETISFYEADFSAAARMSWSLGPGVGGAPGGVFDYQFFSRNRYTDDSAAAAFSAGVAHSNLSTQPFTWNLAEEAGGAANRSMLVEFFPSDDANLVAAASGGSGGNRQQELGLLPFLTDDARTYFEGNPVVTYPDYVDENSMTWRVRSKAGPGIVKSPGRYIIAYPPPGVSRLSGSFRWDRYINWLIAQNASRGSYYMTGLASGLEIGTSAAGGAGAISGKWFPSTSEFPWSGVAAAAYAFDEDVAAFFSRFSNLQGIEVRKAVDAFIAGLKADDVYSMLDEVYLPVVGGTSDMRRAFKSASHDIVDRLGTASFIVKQGLTYAGAGYGGTSFNPATAGGQFTQNNAFMFLMLEADTGAVSASHFGNAGARMGRNTANTGISSNLNSATAAFGGVISSLPVGFSIRRRTGTGPAGTDGASRYQVRMTGSTNSQADPAQASVAMTSAEFEVGRSGSGSVYSSAVMSVMAYGGGLSDVQTDTFHARVLALRTALRAAGI